MNQETNAIREKLAALVMQEGYRARYNTAYNHLIAEEKTLSLGHIPCEAQTGSEENDSAFSEYDAQLEQTIAELVNKLREGERQQECQDREAWSKILASRKAEEEHRMRELYIPAPDLEWDDELEQLKKWRREVEARVKEADRLTEEEKQLLAWQRILEINKGDPNYSEETIIWAKRTACEQLGLNADRLVTTQEKQPLSKLPYPVIDYPERTSVLIPPDEPTMQHAPFKGSIILFVLAAAAFFVFYRWLTVYIGRISGLVLGVAPMVFFLIKALIAVFAYARERSAAEEENQRAMERYREKKEQYDQKSAAQAEGKKKQQAANAEVDAKNREIDKQNVEIEQFNKALRSEKAQSLPLILRPARKVLFLQLEKLWDDLAENYRDFLPEKCRNKESVEGLLEIFDYGRAETLPEALRLLYDDRMKQQAQTT